jgi:hypothetical protein
MSTANVSYGETTIDYVGQLQNRLKEAYTTVNQKLIAVTDRMKTRYSSRVNAIQLKPGQLVMYYCPQRPVEKYQKWRRLCKSVRWFKGSMIYCTK